MRKETVCITSASGGTGERRLERLAERRGCTAVWGDLGDEEALSKLVSEASYVFHCAALVSKAPCKHRPLRRYIRRWNLTTKLPAEQAVRDATQATTLECTILRPTCVYGPHTVPYTVVSIHLISKGLPVILGDGQGSIDVVHVDDVVEAALLAARSSHAAGQAFSIGHESVTLQDFYARYGKMLNQPVRRLPLSVLVGSLSDYVESVRIIRADGSAVKLQRSDRLFPAAIVSMSLWLSPAFKQEVCWLEFCCFPHNDSFFHEMHELLRPLAYRFHWGKATVADRAYVRRQYEKWDEGELQQASRTGR